MKLCWDFVRVESNTTYRNGGYVRTLFKQQIGTKSNCFLYEKGKRTA